MKNIRIYLISLWALIFIACSNEESVDYSQVIQSLQMQLQKDELLKSTVIEGDDYILEFEKQTVEIPVDAVQDLIMDVENWQSVLTFINGTTVKIPTQGASIDKLITNIIVNPSGHNPLSAKAVMNLPALGRIKLIVHSKPGKHTPDIEYLFNSIEKGQNVTILGLYPNYNNQVELIYFDRTGSKERGRTLLNIKTGIVESRGFNSFHLVKAILEQMEPGMNLINSPGEGESDTSVPYMVDADGELRWLLDMQKWDQPHPFGMQCGLQRLQNGNYIAGDFNNHLLLELDVLGNIVNKWNLKALGYSFHHEVTQKSDGKLLVTVSNNNAWLPDHSNLRVLDHIIEFNLQLGSLTKSWDIAMMLDTERLVRVDQDVPGSEYYGQNRSNWLHNNGVDDCPDGGIVATGRWQGIFKYLYDGSLKWIIAPHNNWRGQYLKYLLTPLDKNGNPITDPDVLNGNKSHEDFEWCWGVHCPVALPNGHILAFDNGYCRNWFSDKETYSRVVEYEIDEKNMTVRQVWQYGKERGEDCMANAMSAVAYLPITGNRLFVPSIGNLLSNGKYGGRVIEVNPNTNEVVFELEIENNSYFHRGSRLSLYPDGL